MRLHTSVMSLAPIKPHRGALPDMLSGGGRQILASYTEFSYQGNFSDAACRLIDTLPHQSPALGGQRKGLQSRGKEKGRSKRLGATSERADSATNLKAVGAVEKIRHQSGDNVFYLYMTATLGMLCVTDGLPMDEEVFEYLALVERKVYEAVAPLRKADAEKVRRAASKALIESMSTWTSQADAGDNNRHHSPMNTPSATPIGGRLSDPSSPDPNGRFTLERCLKEAVRSLRIDRVDQASPPQQGNGVGGSGVNPVRSSDPPRPPVPLLAPEARRPRPNLRGPLSPGPRGGVATMDGPHLRSRSTPVVTPSVGSTHNPGVILSRPRSSPRSSPNGFRPVFNGREGDGSGFAPGLIVAAPFGCSEEASFPTPVLVDLEFDPQTAPAVTTSSVTLSSFVCEGDPRLSERSPDPSRPLSLGPPRRQRLLDVGAGVERSIRSTSVVDPLRKRWNTSPPPVSVAGGAGRLDLVRAPTPPLSKSSPPPIAEPHALAPPVSIMEHVPPPPPQQHQQQQQQQQWNPISIRHGTAALGISESAWAQKASLATVGGGPSSDLPSMPCHPPMKLTWSTSESSPSSSCAPGAVARAPTVAEERLRRRRQESLQQHRHYRSAEHFSASKEERCARATNDGKDSTEFRRSSSGGKLPSSLGRRPRPGPGPGSTGSGGGNGGNGSGQSHRAWGSGGALSPSSLPNGDVGGSRESTGRQHEGSPGSLSPVGSPYSPTGSSFRRMNGERRSRTPPPTQGHHRQGIEAGGGAANSGSPRRHHPAGVEGGSGRSESVPPRLRSGTGPQPGECSRPLVELEAEAEAEDEGRVSEDGHSQKLGILLPLDYSGMITADTAGGEAPLLRELDGMARNALKAQVEVSSSDDELVAVMAKFRHTLSSIPLPPPAAVDYEQALKDAQRESIEVNGRVFQGDVEELLTTLRNLVGPLVFGDESLMRTVCQDIVRASSRTSSGGDTYAVVSELLSRPTEGDILTPSGVKSAPIGISVDGVEGEVVITVENSFLLRRNAVDGTGTEVRRPEKVTGKLKAKMVKARGHLDDLVEQTAEQFRKMKARREVWGGPGWSLEGSLTKNDRCCSEDSSPEEIAGISVVGRVEVYLRLLDGSSKRRLRITCPDVERCPPECILLGAGTNEANGTYELTGFRNAAPMYTKENGVTIAKKCLGGREGWIIGCPPNRVLYGQPGDTDLPPDLHWSLVNGGTGLNPPPTLMMHSHRLAKEIVIDIRQMPSPRQNWSLGPNVTFPDDMDHKLMGSAPHGARSPTPATPPNPR